MIFSRSSEYAIRAFIFLSHQEPGKLVMAKQIAEQAGLPSHFLAKLLQQLARKGLVRSNKGPSGGFALGLPHEQIKLLSIIQAVEGIEDFKTCPNGHSPCTSEDPSCQIHNGWTTVRSRIVDYLEHTSLADVSKPASLTNGLKKRRIATKI